jgi:hypothetical protein
MTATVEHQNREHATSEPSIRPFWTNQSEAALARPCWHAARIRRSKHVGIAICVPTAMNTISGEHYQTPPRGTERVYSSLIDVHKLDRVDHFAAWAQPRLFAGEIRTAFRSLR